jgi:hypothetical protein
METGTGQEVYVLQSYIIMMIMMTMMDVAERFHGHLPRSNPYLSGGV